MTVRQGFTVEGDADLADALAFADARGFDRSFVALGKRNFDESLGEHGPETSGGPTAEPLDASEGGDERSTMPQPDPIDPLIVSH